MSNTHACRLRLRVGWKSPMSDEWKAPPNASSFQLSMELSHTNKWFRLPYEEEKYVELYFHLPFSPTKDILLKGRDFPSGPLRVLEVNFDLDHKEFNLRTHDWILTCDEEYQTALKNLKKRGWNLDVGKANHVGISDIKTCKLEEVVSLEIPDPQKTVKGETALKPKPKGWHLQSEPDKSCRWLGSSDRFDPIATFQNNYGTKLQVTTDDYQFVLAIEEKDAYKMTYWWPPEMLKKFVNRFCF